MEMQQVSDNVLATPTRHEDLTVRLAALNRWQDEQKRLLVERQNKQRQELDMEQRNIYEQLGFKLPDTQLDLDDDDEDASDGSILDLPGALAKKDLQVRQVHESIEMPRFGDALTEQINCDFASPHEPVKPKRQFLRRGEGLKQRFKIDPEQLRLNNLPPYKFANTHRKYQSVPTVPSKQKRGILKAQKPNLKANTIVHTQSLPKLDVQEKRFQQLLLKNKPACSSTPDLKSSYSSSESSGPKVRFVELNSEEQSKGQSADDESSGEVNSALAGVCWAKVLDAQQINAPMVERRRAQIRLEDDENVSIFELLEQKAREGNIDLNSSCIRAFMTRKEHRFESANESDQIVVTQQMKEMRLQPQVSEVIDNQAELEEEEEEAENTNSTLTVAPIQIGKTQVRVRFSDSNDTHEYEDETITEQDGSTASGNIHLFEQFKSALFQALDSRKVQPAAPLKDDNLQQELQEKANMVRTRLQELEAEIATFKEQNLQLLRMKQQHEQERGQHEQEHMEAMERVHDEKIKAEIYLHDERMKIEEERRKFEQQMRLQKSNMNSKEKKELAALKQDVENLQLQLKQKEQTHISAQARMRAQLRASEKEQQTYRDEIELLRRENRRLEQEMIKIGRENNTKMLQEINRNIARLAPKVPPPRKTLSEALDENGRRANSLDGNAGSTSKSESAKERDKVRRYSSHSGQGQSKSRSRCSLAKANKSAPLSESLNSSSSSVSDDVVEVEISKNVEINKPVKQAAAKENTDKTAEFKREIVNNDGSRDIWYPNGNLKKISADGMNVRMLYFNKDIKETDIRAGTVKYYYAETNTWHTSYVDGLEILEFPNGQTEHRHKNGVVEIHFPNNSIKLMDPSDTEKLEEWRYADGTHLVQMRNGDKILSLPNGQKEIHTKLNKRREYPDGTVKLVYPDGSQETRYSNGRVRLKDKDGKLIMDTDYSKY